MTATANVLIGDLETLWTVVRNAHGDAAGVAAAARGLLLERYRAAAFRYLLGAVRDPEAAAELTQEFALRFLRGDFRNADPGRGRFRDYVRVSLSRLVGRHRRQQLAGPRPLGCDPPAESGDDDTFLVAWRDALLTRAWEALALAEEMTGQPVFTVLRFRVDHPEMSSSRMAEALSLRLGRPLSAAAARQALHRARERFSAVMIEEVRHSLDDPTDDELIEELIELRLWLYCRAALERHD